MFLVELKDAVFMSGSIELPVQFFCQTWMFAPAVLLVK